MKIRRQAAFTLIELLVVITIIGILASFALPALQNAQVSARQAQDLSNARQVVGALRVYATDNDGKFPSYATDPSGDLPATPVLVTSANQLSANFFPST